MKALNSKYMNPPRSGMISKHMKLLPPAHYYYRFAHSMVNGVHQNREQIIGGAWWMDFDSYNTIRHRSEASGTHPSAMARNSLAIARRWGGKVDIVVRSLLDGPLLGYYGIGTIQAFENDDEGGDQTNWVPAADVIQIYVPGLRQKNPATGNLIFADAFAHVEQIRIGWDPA